MPAEVKSGASPPDQLHELPKVTVALALNPTIFVHDVPDVPLLIVIEEPVCASLLVADTVVPAVAVS